MNRLYVLLFVFFVLPAQAQIILGGKSAKETPREFKGEKTKINDLIHTHLKVKPDLKAHTLDGEAYITLRPHFYPTDSLTLDAKAMKIHEVKVDGQAVKYDYDGWQLKIRLPEQYTRFDTYEVYVKYTARPDSVKTPGGKAIRSNKGLYFINTRGETEAYPPHFWTQGEPEANSVWFPTIDSPNQKSTQLLEMTVPAGWVSLSNGKMIKSTEHPDGTRTDVWEMKKPHAPYLFMMFAGPFAVVKDSADNIPVWYYVEKKYEKDARKIFGKTPEMIRYFSNLLGYEYPWNKYHQVVVRDFVSGAMENTTAVVHSDMAYAGVDGSMSFMDWESVVAHELFHHWFGDLVTAESWAQIAMNEAFATYGEVLWEEHDEGKDKADYLIDRNMQVYKMGGNDKKELIRYYYHNPDDVFDAVSYQKGSLVLHMLRNIVGDSAFFKALHLYLNRNKYDTGEAAQLRLAMEKVSGKDLTLFFDQWFYGNGHPKFKIEYAFDDNKRSVEVKIIQNTGKIWKFPLSIDVYENETRKRYNVFVQDSIETFRFPYRTRPDLINVDADHVLLADIIDTRADDTYYYQFFHARNYMDRKLGLDKAVENKNKPEAFRVIFAALDDPFYVIRNRAIKSIDVKAPLFSKNIEKKLYRLALKDEHTSVRVNAIKKLGETRKKKYVKFYKKLLDDPSDKIKAAAFEALTETDKNTAYAVLTPELEKVLGLTVVKLYVEDQRTDKMNFVAEHLFDNPFAMFSQDNQEFVQKATEWISSSDQAEANRILADQVYALGKKFKKYGIQRMAIFMINAYKKNQSKNTGTHKEEIIRYYDEITDKLKAL